MYVYIRRRNRIILCHLCGYTSGRFYNKIPEIKYATLKGEVSKQHEKVGIVSKDRSYMSKLHLNRLTY